MMRTAMLGEDSFTAIISLAPTASTCALHGAAACVQAVCAHAGHTCRHARGGEAAYASHRNSLALALAKLLLPLVPVLVSVADSEAALERHWAPPGPPRPRRGASDATPACELELELAKAWALEASVPRAARGSVSGAGRGGERL